MCAKGVQELREDCSCRNLRVTRGPFARGDRSIEEQKTCVIVEQTRRTRVVLLYEDCPIEKEGPEIGGILQATCSRNDLEDKGHRLRQLRMPRFAKTITPSIK